MANRVGRDSGTICHLPFDNCRAPPGPHLPRPTAFWYSAAAFFMEGERMTAPVAVHRGTLVAMYTAILFGSFYYDLFRIVEREAYFTELTRHHYLGYDSYLVLDRLHLTERGEAAALSPLTEKYRSQFGLQGVVLDAALRVFHVPSVKLAYFAAGAVTLLTSLLLAAFFADVAKRIGPITAGAGVVLTAWSPQLIYMVPSLYWCAFLLFAPFVLTWLLDPWLSRQKYGSWLRLALVFALVLAKCLCGYEYVTTIILSPIAAIWFHRSGQTPFLRSFLLQSIGVIAAGAAAFACAMLIHVAQLQYVVGVDGFETIRERAMSRTIGEHGQEGVRLPIRKSFRRLPERFAYPATCFVEYLQMPAANTPGYYPACRRPIPVKHFFAFALIAGVAVVVARRWLPADSPRLAGAALIGAAGSLSWNVLALNHMLVHFHLNCITFYVPFLLLGYLAIGHTIESALIRLRMQPMAATAQLPLLIGLALAGALLETNHRAARYGDYSTARDAVATALHHDVPATESSWQYHVDDVREAAGFPAPELDFGSEMNRSRLVQERGSRGKIGVVAGWLAVPCGQDATRLQLFAVRGHRFLPSDMRLSPRPDAANAVGPNWQACGFTMVVRLSEHDDMSGVRIFAALGQHIQELAIANAEVARK